MPRTYYRLNVSNQHISVPKDVVKVVVEEGIIILKAETFDNCTQLKLIIFPRSLIEIEDRALACCPSLEFLFIPNNVMKIGKCAFGCCEALRTVIFERGSKLKSIDKWAFQWCILLKSIVIPKSVISLGNYVFDECENLESVIFEEGSQLQAIPIHCFYKCSKLRAVIVPDAVTIIEYRAFRYCYCLAFVYFSPQSKLQCIKAGAFQSCHNLHFINVPSTIISINDVTFDRIISTNNATFDGCASLLITATSLDQHQLLHWFQHGYDKLPLHQLCFRHIHAMTQEKLDSIPINDPSLIEQDESGLTPLHIVCFNPHANTSIVKQVFIKHTEAATILNINNMTPWHMYLVMKGMIAYPEFRAIINGDDRYKWFDENGNEEDAVVRSKFRALLRESAVLNDIHSLIEMGLEHDDDLYNVTLALHGVPSFEQECNRLNEATGLFPFMAMSASSEFKLCHVYNMAMNTIAHNMQQYH
jgi:hypothetical protein